LGNETPSARARQGQVQILLVQLDAKARLECALDHALAMHFENAAGRETTHQRLAHTRRVGTGLGGEQQRFGHGFDVQRDDDLVGHLRGLAVAIAADERDVLAHRLEQRLHALEGGFITADHDRQRGVLRADLATGHWRVEVSAADGGDARGEVLGGDRRDRTHVHHHLAIGETRRNALLAEQHLLHVGRVGQHQEDDVGTLGDAARARAVRGARCGNVSRYLAARVHEDLVACGDEVAAHRPAHDAQADETEFRRCFCHVSARGVAASPGHLQW
jgi:hypothetical protein